MNLLIGHLAFDVIVDDARIIEHNSRHQLSVIGFTSMSSQEIVLATQDHEGVPLGAGQRCTTLLHEVLHAALEASGLERDPEEEERWINAIQGPLLTALQSAPLRRGLLWDQRSDPRSTEEDSHA